MSDTKEYDVRITGSGTLEEIKESLQNIIDIIENHNCFTGFEHENETLLTKITVIY